MARHYLNNTELNAQLIEQGYVVVPLLNADEVRTLSNIYSEAHPKETIPFYATAHHENTEFRKEMSSAIIGSILNPVDKLFNNCTLLGGSFIVKSQNDQSSLEPHQDWNIVDERDFRSFNIWVPLVDLNDKNGAIEVLPKSHDWVRGIRHASIPCTYQSVHHLVWENMKVLHMKAGEALIYDHSLLHASKANETDEPRVACASGVIPNEAQMFFYWNNNQKIEKYESNADYFMTENIFTAPSSLRKVDELNYDFPSVSESQFYELSGIDPPIQDLKPVPQNESESVVYRLPFWKVYTPFNILKEINYRLGSPFK
jgi:hypothetical protein